MTLGQDGDGVDDRATTATTTVAQEERYGRPRNSFTPINGRRSTAVPGSSQVQSDAPSSSTPPAGNLEQGKQDPEEVRKVWLGQPEGLLERQLDRLIQRGVRPQGQEQQQIQTPAQQPEQQQRGEGPHPNHRRVLESLDISTRDWDPAPQEPGKKTCPYCGTPVRVKNAAEHTKVHRFQDMRPEYFIQLRKGGRCVRCRRAKGQICKVFKDPSRHKTFVCKSCLALRERCSHVDFNESFNARKVKVHPAVAIDAEA